MTYLKKLYTVCVTTHQMALLLAYNDSEVFSVSSLEAFTQLPKHELSNTLHSLLDSKLVLRQQGEGPTELTPQTMIKLNKNYSNKRTKFKVIAASQKDTQQVHPLLVVGTVISMSSLRVQRVRGQGT